MHDNVWIVLFWYITLLCGLNDWQKKNLHAGLIPLRIWIICLLHLYLSPTYCLIRVCHVVVLVYFDFKVLCQNMWMYWTAVNRQVEALCPPVCSTSCRLLSPHQPYSVQVCPRVTLQGTLSQGRYMYRECEIVGEGMEVRVIKIEHGM